MKTNFVFNIEFLFFVFLALIKALLGEQCDSSGINCITCTSYQKCDGGNPVGPVLKGNDCDQKKLEQCHMKYNCYGLNECTQAGVFPDAEDESNYYVCLNDPTAFVKYEFKCVEGEFFDKTAFMCIPKAATLTGSVMSSSSVDVTSETDSSSEASSTSSTESSSTSSTEFSLEISSTSLTESSSEGSSTSPTESSSEGYSTSSTESSEASPTSLTESSSMTFTSSTEITISTTSGTVSTTPPFVCTAPGIFPDPSNCKIYHRCSTSLRIFNYVCPGTSYFNENLLKCSMIITPTCQAQILQNSSSTVTTPVTTQPTPTSKATTTSSPSTTTSTPTISTATTTITAMPFTTTTTTTTTTVPPTTPKAFSCPMSGTFSNPNSCKTYYRCSTSGKSFIYACPGDTYFNEFTKKCSLQITPRCQMLLQS